MRVSVIAVTAVKAALPALGLRQQGHDRPERDLGRIAHHGASLPSPHERCKPPGRRGLRGLSDVYAQCLRAGLALRAASAGRATPEQAAIGTSVVDPEGAAARDDRALAKLAVGGF